MSQEKQVILESLGAKIIRTPTEAPWDDPESHISVAKQLQETLPNAHILDQYNNEENPSAHYSYTAQEIIDDLDGKIDMAVIGAGTGGTISGLGKRLKEHNPKCLIIGVDPIGSILAGEEEVCSYKVEGIGYDFIPNVLNRSLVDKWVKTNDQQSFILARKLIKDEGLLCGGSSGAAMFAALQEAANLKKGQNCVVILADGVRNYMSRFIDDKWMLENHYFTEKKLTGSIQEFIKTTDNTPLFSIKHTESVRHALSIMKAKGFSQIPVTENEALCGILSEKDLLEHLLVEQKNQLDIEVCLLMNRNVPTVQSSTTISFLKKILTKNNCAIVIDQKKRPLRIITMIDLLEWISSRS